MEASTTDQQPEPGPGLGATPPDGTDPTPAAPAVDEAISDELAEPAPSVADAGAPPPGSEPTSPDSEAPQPHESDAAPIVGKVPMTEADVESLHGGR
jgi:hypothetical protein